MNNGGAAVDMWIDFCRGVRVFGECSFGDSWNVVFNTWVTREVSNGTKD